MNIAIYSRKSKFTGKGESIENQIQLCKEYAQSHFEDPAFSIYEDEGFSGKNTARPEFQRMLGDAKNKQFTVLICYRLDRISRNIADFSTLIEELQSLGISFVSIREQFDTSTPMGRAMMFIASVFAQLERETIAERVKDNMLELAKTGRWLGGVPPLGFKSEKVSFFDSEYKERSLVELAPIEDEMRQIAFIYDKYLELGSIHQVRKYLIQNDIKTRHNAHFSSRALSDILRNPAYVRANQPVVEYLESKGIDVAGKELINGSKAILIYNKKDKKGSKNDYDEWIAAIAKHQGHLSPEKWLEVQLKMDNNSMKLPRTGTSEVALLSGIIRCAKCDSAMNVQYGRKRKDGTTPHYYTCHMKTISGQDKCQNQNANGIDIDHAVISCITQLSLSKETLFKELEALRKTDKQSGNINVLDELKSKRQAILDEIDNLVGEISKSSAASKYILPQIEARDLEVKKLDDEIAKVEKENEDNRNETEGINLVINNIMNFAKVINNLSNKEKKSFLQTIVDKVYWDGETGQAAIKLLGMDVSQFRTTSSRSGYQYHTMGLFHHGSDLLVNTAGKSQVSNSK